MNCELEFVGIPELKERRPITVEDIFVRLRAEREAGMREIPAELLAQQMEMRPPGCAATRRGRWGNWGEPRSR